MISLDPVELLKRIVEVTVQDTLQRNLIPSAFIIPIVFRVKLFRYHVIKFYDIETMDNGNFPYLNEHIIFVNIGWQQHQTRLYGTAEFI